MNSNKVSH